MPPASRVPPRGHSCERSPGQGLWTQHNRASCRNRASLIAFFAGEEQGAVGGPRATKATQAQERLQAGGATWYHDRFKALRRDADAPVVRLPDARHAFGSYLLDEGVPLPLVSGYLGHTSMGTTASTYAHTVQDDTTHERLRQALAAGL